MATIRSLVSMARYVLFIITFFYIVRAFMPHPGLRNKTLYYEFCKLRRDLMHLVMTDKVNINCLSFEFFMRYLSDIIRYSDDYKFGTRSFIKIIQRDSDDLLHKKFIHKLMADVEKQDKEFKELVMW